MSPWDELDSLAGPTDAQLRQSENRGAQVAAQKRRIAFLYAKRAKASLSPAEQAELTALLEARYSP